MTRHARTGPGGRGAAVVVLLAAGLLVVLGALIPGPASPASPAVAPAGAVELLPSALQVCPGPRDVVPPEQEPQDETGLGLESRVDAAGVPDPALRDADVDGAPLLTIREIDEGEELATLASTTVRGQTLSSPTSSSTAVTATGELAPALAAEVTTSAADVRTSGLASQPCVTPAREWWFAAGSGEVGQRAVLVLGNPAQAPAVVDVVVWTESGALPGAGTNDLGVPAGGTRTISLDAVATGAARIAVSVTASVGRVGAALGLRQVDGADPVGLSWVTASQPPARRAYVPGLPAVGDRTLRLLNPGDDDAVVSLRAVAEQGTFAPLGLGAIDVPAGQVLDVDLEAAGEEAFALEVDSTVPVVSSALVRQRSGDALSDIAAVGSAITLDAAATRVSSRDARSTSLVLTAVPDAPRPTPDVDSDVAPSSPAGVAGESTPTQVVLRLVADDGTLLTADVVTLARGTTQGVPVELPAGITDAWVVVVAMDPEIVLAARQTTATRSVPDALDPDTVREALWFDLVALLPLRTTVVVPAVLAEITAGLPR